MKQIVIISGPSASGKSTLAREIVQNNSLYAICPKTSNTPLRPSEDEIPIHLRDCTRGKSLEEVQNCDFKYEMYGHSYGFQKQLINETLLANKTPLLVCSSPETIASIREEYSKVSIPVFAIKVVVYDKGDDEFDRSELRSIRTPAENVTDRMKSIAVFDRPVLVKSFLEDDNVYDNFLFRYPKTNRHSLFEQYKECEEHGFSIMGSTVTEQYSSFLHHM